MPNELVTNFRINAAFRQAAGALPPPRPTWIAEQLRKATRFDALLAAAKMARSDLELPFSHSHDTDVRHAYMALSAGIANAEEP